MKHSKEVRVCNNWWDLSFYLVEDKTRPIGDLMFSLFVDDLKTAHTKSHKFKMYQHETQ